MEINTENIIYYAAIVEAGIPALISAIAVSKNKVKEERWKLVQEMAKTAMSDVEAESKKRYMTSEQKLEMCLDIIEINAKAAGFKWKNTLKEQVKNYVNEMCSWSKTVNSNSVTTTTSTTTTNTSSKRDSIEW